MVADGGVDERTRTHFTPSEVAAHNSSQDDCWVSFLGRVYDLTPLLIEHAGDLVQPIADAAGKDISHWFDKGTGDVKRWENTETGLPEYYTPMGRFLHIPPSDPSDNFQTDFGLPWWMDHLEQEPKYWLGMLSQKRVRRVRIVNMLTKDEHTIEVCAEDTVDQISDKYLVYNSHAQSYTWKRLPTNGTKDMIVLDMTKTLEDNGLVDEGDEFEELGIDEDYYVPSVHLYFKDDLTEG
mmetsp:Transcript_46802/g.117264  ORF Transcript_46802/g.117264 Transcript_46802/m.117264 type:complete len:237 (+) Transcript_46802:80-790(+)|eukprot:CAMPEP_0173423960 /NCGR_PEP_ID=MMETSP1357-20121228/4039_1 /TAXON_ID=77926 /ORGANISM="Hemiselmis rufescens, Strain PCC563" /LENGTH=236 /DNA_ID=CAMNT_0014387125 /DNA_START=77 /DNA_END=787 /DNA_ORIENTATION=+